MTGKQKIILSAVALAAAAFIIALGYDPALIVEPVLKIIGAMPNE